METTYKGDKITTNGLSEQHVFEIKSDYYGSNKTIQEIALKYCITIDQVNYAILLNE